MSDHDDDVRRAYRAASRDEPPARLDDAILAASRRALAPRSFTRRWGAPLSVAAVLVLAVGITLEMRREEPGVEISAPRSAGERAPGDAAPAPASAPAVPAAPPGAPAFDAGSLGTPAARRAPEATRATQPGPSPAPTVPAAPAASSVMPGAPAASSVMPAAPAASPEGIEASKREAPAPPNAPPALQHPRASDAVPAPRAFEAPQAAPSADMNAAVARRAPSSASAPSSAGASVPAAKAAAANARTQLERIARLRAEGHDQEADRALDAFRRRFPDYRIDDATWERVRPR